MLAAEGEVPVLPFPRVLTGREVEHRRRMLQHLQRA